MGGDEKCIKNIGRKILWEDLGVDGRVILEWMSGK
jgi:hypothetical protein